MILTKEIFELGKSSNNGWNLTQIRLFGVDKLYKGWQMDLTGKDFPESIIKEFIELKDLHFKKRIEKGGLVKMKVAIKMNTVTFTPVFKPLTFKEQYLHPNWQKMRLHIFKRDNYKCIDCGSIDKTLHAHHLKYAKDKFIWECPIWYLVTLCEDCHSKEHGRDLTIKK